MELIILFWILCGVAASIVMGNKGRSGCGGFALGFLLGPIGLIIALVLSADNAALERQELQTGSQKKCQFCAEIIRAEATKCRHCGSVLQRPMDGQLAQQLQFSRSELDCYREKQLDALEAVIATGNPTSQANVCASICKKIGRPIFEGPPREFLVAYCEQLRQHLRT